MIHYIYYKINNIFKIFNSVLSMNQVVFYLHYILLLVIQLMKIIIIMYYKNYLTNNKHKYYYWMHISHNIHINYITCLINIIILIYLLLIK